MLGCEKLINLRNIIMKKLIIMLMAISSFNVFAENLYDNQITQCKNGNYQLTIEGKTSFFGSRNIVVKKAGQTIIDESYEEMHYPFSDRNGPSIMGETAYNDIRQYGYKTKPHSFNSDMDYDFRVSDNTIVLQTYSSLQPNFGGDTSSIILQLIPYKTIVSFEIGTQCSIKRQ